MKSHLLLFTIVLISLANEFLSGYFSQVKHSIIVNTNLYILINSTLWILVLHNAFRNKNYLKVLFVYLFFGLINLLFIEDINQLNSTNFIIGSIIYLILFIIESYNNLKKENLSFFLSNKYTLLFAPVLFFIGFSLMLSFRSKELTSFLIYDDVKLYTLIGNFVNIVYYTLINIYILKERKIKNG